MIPSLPDRDLTLDELRALAREIVARPELWQARVRYETETRFYECLHRDAHVDIWLIAWTEEQDTGFHDHDTSSGAVEVIEGALVEERLRLGGPPHRKEISAGEGTTFDPSHVHRLRQDGPGSSLSIHAYSPPLWRLGVYGVDADGVLRRESVSYAEELRPVESLV